MPPDGSCQIVRPSDETIDFVKTYHADVVDPLLIQGGFHGRFLASI